MRWDAVVRYADDTSGGELPQLLNVIFGNTSIKENVMVTDLTLSPTLTNAFLGPRFGTAGLRDLLGVRHTIIQATQITASRLPRLLPVKPRVLTRCLTPRCAALRCLLSQQ